jgi:hypothetical protein
MSKLTIILVSILVGASPVAAQVTLDVAKITCEQFATSSVANPDRIAIWLNGFFHGKRGDTLSHKFWLFWFSRRLFGAGAVSGLRL